MKKRGILVSVLILFLLPVVIADSSVDSEMKKITHYAEEYESGNIDYVKLMMYVSSSREVLNNILGATSKFMGGVLKQEQIQKILGEPNEDTKWVWVEGENHDAKLDYSVPIWKKIVFDGKKIQIRLEAFPSIFKKKSFDEFLNKEEKENFIEEMPEEGSIIYRLHFEVEFKKPQEQIDIRGKIDKIEELAKSGASMETLAKESVNAEMIFNNYFRQGGGKCEDIMKAVFGSENQRQTQHILLNEIEFFSNEKFEAILRIEMCDECEWNYINIEMRLEGRGNFKPQDNTGIKDSMKRFENMDDSQFRAETAEILPEIKSLLEAGDYSGAMSSMEKLRTLTEAWNKKANDIWQQIEKPIEQPEGNKDPYWWIKQDQAQRQKADELRKRNYENRKEFYLALFSGYNKDEYYFEQTDFEKRLIEEFKERGQEICNNNQDDNKNEQVDCDDSQCGGKICGRGLTPIVGENGTDVIEVDYYCIAKTCQAKEIIDKTQGPVCGNNFCEEGEEFCSSSSINCKNETECSATADCGPVYCPEDCVICPEHPPIQCSGRVEFSGEDENKCPLEPICIEEEIYCNVDLDCPQLLCGLTECVKESDNEKGICKVKELTLCNQGECEDGEKQRKECSNNQKVVVKVCIDGMWKETGKECEEVKEKVCCQSPASDEPTYKWKLKEECQSSEKPEGQEIVDDSYCEQRLEENCNEYCWDYMSTTMPECHGNLEISGNYPDCKCEWVCDEIVNNECATKDDCGGKNDVCSNGKCETLPEIIPIEHEKPEVTPEPEKEVEEEIETEIQEELEFEIEIEGTTTEEPEPENKEPVSEEFPVTGKVIFGFFKTLLSKMRITGYAVNEGTNEEPGPEPEPEESPQENTQPESPSEQQPIENGNGQKEGPKPEPDNECRDKWKACGDPCPPCDYEQRDYEERDDNRGWEEKDKREREMHEQENRERCKKECARPCVEKCIRENCGEQMDCNIDEESRKCESGCSSDENCINKCMSGEEDWWMEFKDEHKEEKGVFQVGGGCRKEQGKTNGYIWFGGWGEPFSEIEQLKRKYYEFGDEDWCKYEAENLIKQRKEFEKGFNQEFAVWFFEKYLANSAEEWEQAVSGIFELYWINVDNQMRLAHSIQCLGKSDINELTNVNLIDIEYETDYGKLEYWEELKEVDISKMNGMDKKVTLISPYMKVWVFPSKEFIKYEMKKSMEKHEIPGPPEEKMERKNQEGLTEKQKQEIKEDEGSMEMIKEISEKYNGNFDLLIQFKDYETNEIVFNMYVNVNEKDIMKVEPMLPSEALEKDAVIEMDFELLYELIFISEKDMMGDNIESPPWDKRIRPIQKIKEIGNGIKMWNKMRALKNSAIITPSGNEGEIKKITEWVMENIMGPGPGEKENPNKEMKSEEKGELPGNLDKGIAGKAVWVD